MIFSTNVLLKAPIGAFSPKEIMFQEVQKGPEAAPPMRRNAMIGNGKETPNREKPQIAPQDFPPRSDLHPHSLIGKGMAVDGVVRGKGNLVIGGTVKGEISLEGHRVSIEEGGIVEADIQAESALIQGVLKGNLTATGPVQLDKTANFEGDLKASRLRMEDGVRLKGGIDLQMD
jgi:cytoskeletal protein CcmA (bactofilin family)